MNLCNNVKHYTRMKITAHAITFKQRTMDVDNRGHQEKWTNYLTN